jgi:hypothetical protein
MIVRSGRSSPAARLALRASGAPAASERGDTRTGGARSPLRAIAMPGLPRWPPAHPAGGYVPAGQSDLGRRTPEPCAQVRILLGAPPGQPQELSADLHKRSEADGAPVQLSPVHPHCFAVLARELPGSDRWPLLRSSWQSSDSLRRSWPRRDRAGETPSPRNHSGSVGTLRTDRLAGPDLDRFPPPAVVILAEDLLAVSGHARRAVISFAAELTGLIAGSLVAERIARGGWRRCSRRCRRWRGSRGARCRWRASGADDCQASARPAGPGPGPAIPRSVRLRPPVQRAPPCRPRLPSAQGPAAGDPHWASRITCPGQALRG